MTSLTAEHETANRWYDRGRLTLAYQDTEESRHDRNFGDAMRRHRYERVGAFTANLDLKKMIRPALIVLYGAEAVHNRIGSTANAENIESGERVSLSTRYPDGSTWSSFALYLGSEFGVGTRWSLHLGLRYNLVRLAAEFDSLHFPFPFSRSELTTGAVTGNAGIVFAPSDSWILRANGATGFRAPNIDDVGKVFDSEPGSVVVPNPGLSPEYAYSGEAGALWLFADRVAIEFAVYYTYLDDAMVRRDFTYNGADSIVYDGTLSRVQAIQNGAYASVYGFQIAAEAQLLPVLTVRTNLTVQGGKEELDDGTTAPLRHIGPWFGSTRLSYKSKRVASSVSFVYNGEVSYENLLRPSAIVPTCMPQTQTAILSRLRGGLCPLVCP